MVPGHLVEAVSNVLGEDVGREEAAEEDEKGDFIKILESLVEIDFLGKISEARHLFCR